MRHLNVFADACGKVTKQLSIITANSDNTILFFMIYLLFTFVLLLRKLNMATHDSWFLKGIHASRKFDGHV